MTIFSISYSASEMTYSVSSGALNSTHSLLSRILLVILGLQFFHCNKLLIVSLYYAAAWHFNLGSDFSLWVSGHNLKSKTNLDESSARR